MAGKVLNIGERKILAAAMANVGAWAIKLAKAAFDPDDGLAPEDFTEADYTGYLPQVLTFTGLTAGNPAGKAVAEFTELTFTCGGNETPNDVYGYWVEDADGDVVACERFSGTPRRMRSLGHVVTVPFCLRLFSPV